jgi:hypothetical protein
MAEDKVYEITNPYSGVEHSVGMMYSATAAKLSNYGKKNTHLTPPKKKRKKK